MELLNTLKETEESKKTNWMFPFDENSSFRMFKHINHKGYKISIQACYGHYCSPRKTFQDLTLYDSMEMAVIGPSGEFTTVDELAPDFNRTPEFESHFETVYAYVPVELLNELYCHLTKEEVK